MSRTDEAAVIWDQLHALAPGQEGQLLAALFEARPELVGETFRDAPDALMRTAGPWRGFDDPADPYTWRSVATWWLRTLGSVSPLHDDEGEIVSWEASVAAFDSLDVPRSFEVRLGEYGTREEGQAAVDEALRGRGWRLL